ncbi:hypothetical protein KC333_g8265 [Hortaea werneckii]|nr:hypothetical protein KC333_g8265 [Hortaea werneckii]KAI7314075.1 hypothetical protein KC326_g5185 [Hortaea werneckii]
MDDSSSTAHGSHDAESSWNPRNSYEFMNHSNTSLPNLQSHIDDKPLARQKRKRTSPEDQAVLEAAYKRDPKPDKNARLDIVNQVSMGEKEVQIWFQNRRQSSRRKSRPLLPHEIAQYQMAKSSQNTGGDTTSAEPSSDLPEIQPDAASEEQGERQQNIHGPARGVQPAVTEVRRQSTTGYAHPPAAVAPMQPAGPAIDLRATSDATHPEGSARPRVPGIQAPWEQSAQHLGYLANRRSAESLRQNDADQSFAPIPAPVSGAPLPEARRRLKKTASTVRLSMSFDGNATVTTKNGEEPSPPRAQQVMLPSASATPLPAPQFSSSPAQRDPTSATRNSLQRSASGRSRDSRAWEFWCDKDARSELEDKAEKDASGSAADAIGLLRSASGRSVLGNLPSKRSSLLSRTQSEIKRHKPNSKRPTLQRSNTSSGRLQAEHTQTSATSEKPRTKLKQSESAISISIPGNESDKENWSPERDQVLSSQPASQPVAGGDSSIRRPALGEKRNAANTFRPGESGVTSTKRKAARLEGDSNDPEKDIELAAFMHRQRKSNSTSSEDDLDCVQGLLSLSQGNWR